MRYKLLIIDLDGTTVPSKADGMPSAKVRDALIKAHNFIKISVATGRPFFLAKNILQNLKIDGPCVLDGGSQIMDIKKGKVLFERFLTVEKQKEILKVCLPFGYPILSSEKKNSLMSSQKAIKKKTGKFVVAGITQADTIKLLEELTAIEYIVAHPVSNSWVRKDLNDIHITHIEASKKNAIEKLLDILNLEKDQVIGVGDSHNDLPLFSSVGLKVAMGNAPKELREIADYIAPSLKEDGVVKVVEKFILRLRV